MTGQYPGEVRLDANGKPVTLLQLKAEYGNEKKLRRSVGSALRFVGFLALQLFLQIRRRLRPWQPIAIRGRSLYPWPPIAARVLPLWGGIVIMIFCASVCGKSIIRTHRPAMKCSCFFPSRSLRSSWKMAAVSTWRRAVSSRMPKISVPVPIPGSAHGVSLAGSQTA